LLYVYEPRQIEHAAKKCVCIY